ncbi:MAG: hypothetical protein JWP89_4203 [Schlesneria sp.]|nr:hypothetical protein [Schlesneria sp.]
MKSLLIASAVIELGAGLGLLCFPVLVVTLLTGESIGPPAALVAVRLGGAGLFSLGVACWTSQLDKELRAARSVITAMLAYNIGAASVLGYAGITHGLSQPLLWAAVVLHTVMTIWCTTRLAIRA